MSPFEEKVLRIEKKFTDLKTQEERYHLLMDLGRSLPPFPPAEKRPENLVSGCQSLLYLHSTFKDGRMHYAAHSDALISAGLAALLLSVYNNETPETILKHPPTFIQKIGLHTSLSPSRSNGLAHLYRKMVQAALQAQIKFNQ